MDIGIIAFIAMLAFNVFNNTFNEPIPQKFDQYGKKLEQVIYVDKL